VRLVGTHTENIIKETMRLLDDPEAYKKMTRSINPYGDGKAASRIVKALHET
jgi:UDP-N-acetylglucosamine 2-epimerase (non-hydrolysing)